MSRIILTFTPKSGMGKHQLDYLNCEDFIDSIKIPDYPRCCQFLIDEAEEDD